jgi:phage shock protein PspC (stress-responsive transcriptional regulator)
MPFAYYDKLSAHDKTIYRLSDSISIIEVPDVEGLRPLVAAIGVALNADDRRGVQAAAAGLCDGFAERLGVPPVKVEVLAVRPTLRAAELHGLYTYGPGRPPRIRVWMRTVHYKRVVAFRTFLRTLLHELCHHLDYRYLKLADSFHTEGFFRRESSLFRQLVSVEDGGRPRRPGPTS